MKLDWGRQRFKINVGLFVYVKLATTFRDPGFRNTLVSRTRNPPSEMLGNGVPDNPKKRFSLVGRSSFCYTGWA